MPTTRRVANLDDKFAAFTDLWSPKIVAQMNDIHVKVVKVEGEFVWHTHDDTDELFLVHRGELTIELRGQDDVVLGPGDIFVVPKGVEHRPVAGAECEAVLLEPVGVVNTGDVAESEKTAIAEWI
jgi:mannose-6-phosphate isomerase-like protein (cupin superfamily)